MNTLSVAVCIATYNRPEGLRNVLQSIAHMDGFMADLQVIIVDNDAEGSGKATVESARKTVPFSITYLIEPRRGICHARNRLVATARERNVDYIAWVDDDETVDEKWVVNLIREAERTGAAAIAGRNLSWMDNDIPISRKNCFPNTAFSTGKKVKKFGAGNALVRVSALEGIPGPFDLRVNLTGGEDSLLSAELQSRGHMIVWCNDAVTHEYVPRSRTTVRYILQRAFRTGTTRSKIARWVNPSPRNTTVHILNSVAIIAKHLALMVPNIITRRDLLLFRLRCIASGIGGIVGTLTSRAYAHQEYQNTHGS